MRMGTAVGVLLWSCAGISLSASVQPTSPPVERSPSSKAEQSFEIYCDFRCPYCARLFIKLLAGATAEERVVSFQLHHFPFHQGSEKLSLFYEAAMINYPDKKDELIQSLYKFREQTKSEMLGSTLPALSIVHGMDYNLIKRDMKARDALFAVSESKRSAVAEDVSATPTVFYHAKKIVISEPEEIARYILDRSPGKPKAASESTPDPACDSCQISGRGK